MDRRTAGARPDHAGPARREPGRSPVRQDGFLVDMDSSSLRFRAAIHADTSAVVALVESAYRGDASRVGWTTEADFLDGRRTGPDEIKTILEQPQSRIVLAEHDGHVIACAHVVVEDGGG